jgi:hypothetical protein
MASPSLAYAQRRYLRIFEPRRGSSFVEKYQNNEQRRQVLNPIVEYLRHSK